jgi:NAD+ kinase
VTTLALVVHPGREAAAVAAEALRSSLGRDGVRVVTMGADGEPPDASDLVVSIGGDGTFLRAAHAAWSASCPVLGVKVGRMGFLTEVEPDQAEALVREALEGRARIEERLAVTAAPLDGPSFPTEWALNEVMIEKHARHRLVRLVVSVDGTYVATFSADGVIVATPTGSTAYSFSARGPIVTPSVNCIVLTPVAAHMVFDRSFVLDAAQEVTIEVIGDEMGLLSADGRQSIELPVGSRLRIHRAERSARLVRRDDAPGFLSLVREKFGLPGPNGSGVGGPG